MRDTFRSLMHPLIFATFATAPSTLLAASPGTENSYFHKIEYLYQFTGGETHPISASGSFKAAGPIEKTIEQSLEFYGPAETQGRVTLVGGADFERRRFRAKASAESRFNPFPDDFDILRNNPRVYDSVGRVDTIVSDDVRIHSNSVPLGYPLSFAVAPSLLHGVLYVPLEGEGMGTASVQVGLSLLGFQPEGEVVPYSPARNRVNSRSFEKILRTGDERLGYSFVEMPVVPDARPDGSRASFTVFNGEVYIFELHLTAIVQAVPYVDGSNNENPPTAESEALFTSTYYYNGLTGFADGSGNPLTDVTFTSMSGSGFDWVSPEAAPVPEPEALWLMLAGTGVIAWGTCGRRRPARWRCQGVGGNLGDHAAVRR